MELLLERAPMLSSRSVDETRAFLASKAIALTLTGGGRSPSVDAQINGLYLPNLWLGCIRYGADASVRISGDSSMWSETAPRKQAAVPGDYWIYLPVRGGFEIRMQGMRLACDERRGVVLSPCDVHEFRTEPQTVRLSLSLRGAALERELFALLGDVPRTPLQFEPELGLDDGHGARLGRMLRWVAAEFGQHDPLATPALSAEFESFFSTWLLLSQPSNYSAAIAKRTRPVAPRDVRRAIEYIRDNLAQPITLADLVEAAGVPGRTLLKHFRDFHGLSPMRHLRHLRMQRARDELACGRATEVAECALRWSFAHVGRFAVEYRKRFGENPSATVKRARAVRRELGVEPLE